MARQVEASFRKARNLLDLSAGVLPSLTSSTTQEDSWGRGAGQEDGGSAHPAGVGQYPVGEEAGGWRGGGGGEGEGEVLQQRDQGRHQGQVVVTED